jgi:hypothetical protein
MSMVGFPLLLIPLAIYNIFVFLMPGVAFTSPIVSVTLMSGVVWTVTFGDALLAFAMLLLMFEVIKAARGRYVTDHLLSLTVFGAATAEFVLLAPCGNSTFFLLIVLTAVEFFAGLVIGIRNRKRRVRPEPPVAAPAPVRREPVVVAPPPAPPAPVSEPHFERPTPEPTRADHIVVDRPQAPDVKVEEPKPVASPPVVHAPPAQEIEMPPTPAPSPATVQTAESREADRKIADWNVSHLIKDNESEPAKDADTKPADPPASPKP